MYVASEILKAVMKVRPLFRSTFRCTLVSGRQNSAFPFSDHRNPIYAKFVTDLDWYDVGSKRFTQIVKYTREKALTMRSKNRKNQKSICPLKRRFHVWGRGVLILLFLNFLLSKTKKCWPFKNCG